MTSKELYVLLAKTYGVGKKLPKREVYDKVLTDLNISPKQLGGMVSVLSRSGLAVLDKTTLTLVEEKTAE